ncbi:MAG: hypothetical protein IJO47_03370 [Clostridia bacterium]|nr:hypothetical protein [Clostridia bacterium]
MEFRKKLKTRLYIAIAYIIIGAITTAVAFGYNIENEFFSAYGIALIICGAVRLRQYIKLTSSEENIRKQEIAESDERNIAIANKARSWAFYFYVILVGVAVIILEIIGKAEIATAAAMSICALIVLYWISYYAISRKM